jgi:dimeric dUTPase (all-alpha-NTP-PPase superfamily)
VVFYKNSTLKKKRFLAALEFIIKRNPTQISKQQSSTDLTQAFDRTFIKIGSFVNLQKPMKNSFLLQQYDDGNF